MQESGELRIGLRVHMAVGGNGMQRLRDQQVDIAIMQLQRGQARIIVAHVEGGAQRFVILRDFAQARRSCACGRAEAASPSGLQGMACRPPRVSGRNNSGNSGLRTTFSRNTTSTSGEKRAR